RLHRPADHTFAPLRREAGPVLFGGDQLGAKLVGAVGEEAEVRVAEGGVVGEGGEVLEVGAGGQEGALDLPRLGDAGEADQRAGRRRGGGLEAGDEDGQGAEGGDQVRIGFGGVGGQQD